jgi:hypothetical protein
MTPCIMINNQKSRKVRQILFQGKVALGLDDRFDLVWNGSEQVFQGFRANHFPAGIYRGLKIFKISREGF